MEKRKTISLFDDVAGNSDVTERYEFPESGTIEGAWIRNYPGHGFDVHYEIEIEDRGGRKRSLFNHLGKEFIAGDADTHQFNLREEFEAGETLIISAENNEGSYSYHASARVEADYEGGVMGILGKLGGLF